MGLGGEVLVNIGLVVGGLRWVRIGCFGWVGDGFGGGRVYMRGGLMGRLRGFGLFMGVEGECILWIVLLWIMVGKIGDEMVVCVEEGMFREMFGGSYGYSGGGVGYEVGSVVGGGFRGFIGGGVMS